MTNEKEVGLMPDRMWIGARVGERIRALLYTASDDETDECDVEYVRADLLATVRAEERRAALEEAIKWAQKVQAVKLDAAQDAESSNEFAAMRLSHEASGAERVIETLKAAIENPMIIRKEGRGMVKELSRVTLTAREAADLEETLTNVADDLESHGLGDSESCAAARRWARWIEEGNTKKGEE